MTATDGTGRPTRRAARGGPVITVRRLVTSVILAGALALLVWGLSTTRPTNTAVTYNDEAVQLLEPEPGALALRQEHIAVTLKPAYTLAQANASGMSINSTPIPQDEIQVLPSLNQYIYTPGEGKAVTALPPGRNCATVIIKVAANPADPGHPFAWCFNSH
jgi:hypothetical protein